MEIKLSDLIARLKVPGLKESNERHMIAKALSDVLTIPIKPNQIQLKEGILFVNVPPVVKSALHIKQKEIVGLIAKEGITVRGIT